jgi:hypothetical protein
MKDSNERSELEELTRAIFALQVRRLTTWPNKL